MSGSSKMSALTSNSSIKGQIHAIGPHKLSTIKRVLYCTVHTYSLRPKLSTKYCFTKQICQIQIGVTQWKSTAMPLSTKYINTTRQHFQMRYTTLFYLKWLKSYQLSKFKCVGLLSKTDFTFLLWLRAPWVKVKLHTSFESADVWY